MNIRKAFSEWAQKPSSTSEALVNSGIYGLSGMIAGCVMSACFSGPVALIYAVGALGAYTGYKAGQKHQPASNVSTDDKPFIWSECNGAALTDSGIRMPSKP